MSFIYENVLSDAELYYLNNHPNVLLAKTSLDAKPSGMVHFSVPITDSIRATLQSKFGLKFSENSQIPMRWIKGDTIPHVLNLGILKAHIQSGILPLQIMMKNELWCIC